jgi:hypothetical protein
MAGTAVAAETGIPASLGMPGGGLTALTLEEQLAVEGGDLYLAVDRDTQMMTVTRVTPGDYGNTESYAVKVTTSVVRNSDVSTANPKGAMENTKREVDFGSGTVLTKQFPTGTAKLSSTVGSQPEVTGPVIRSSATQPVAATANLVKTGATVTDSGYNIHYVDPAKSTNTLGCIGVQSQQGMTAVVATLNRDTASYKADATVKQTVAVSSYTNNTPAPASAFKPSPPPPPPAPVVVTPARSYPSSVASIPASKPWWRFW